MKIYTGFGDEGQTRLYGGKVVSKDHLRIEVYGTIDELNSLLGLVISQLADEHLHEQLMSIQNDLFQISAVLATPDQDTLKKLEKAPEPSDIKRLEQLIDRMDEKLEPLQNFILPGGTTTASFLHLARTVCRRAERRLTSLMATAEIDSDIIIYLNRLSDLLFVAARYVNYLAGVTDIPWQKKQTAAR